MRFGSPEEADGIYRVLVESVRDYAIFAFDPTGHIVSWNAGAQRIKGYTASEIIGRHFSIFYPPEDLEWDKPGYELEVAAREGRFEDEGWRVRKDGTQFWANVVITALRDQSGALIGFGKVTRDLTERRRASEQAIADARRIAAEEAAREAAEARANDLLQIGIELERRTWEAESAKQELSLQLEEAQAMSEELELANTQMEEAMEDAQNARAAAEQANLTKRDFLAAMSHELRTPLNAIGGYSDLLMMGLRGPITPEQRQDLERIRHSQQHLLGIINDILNFSRIEAGHLTYEIAEVRLGAIVASVSAMITPQAEHKGVRYVHSCPTKAIVRADGPKVEQILLNLLSNAVKFTPAGGEIRLFCDTEGAYLRLHVRDTGPGIAADKLSAVFEPFVQINRSLTQGSEGTGLGLAISRDLAHGMAGNITVISELGNGSTFTLWLPQV